MKINCPKCGTEINPALALGKLAKGKPKNYSPEEIERRTRILDKINDLRSRRLKLEAKVKKIQKDATENPKAVMVRWAKKGKTK